MPVKQVASKKETKTTITSKVSSSLAVPMFSLKGENVGSLVLPEEIFAAGVNKSLLAQSLRVYSTNRKSHWSNTKTRGEVAGSTRKIYRQKGTGHARHGAVTAPIFVHGGIALGPKTRKTILDLPKKMKQQALISALSQKMAEKEVVGIVDLDSATGKTKQMVSLFTTLAKNSALIVIGNEQEMAKRAVQNIEGFKIIAAPDLNSYEVIKYQSLMLTREALDQLQQRLSKTRSNSKLVKGI